MHRADFDPTLPPTASQWRKIAEEALALLELPVPAHREDAVVTIIRLSRAEPHTAPAAATDQTHHDHPGHPALASMDAYAPPGSAG